MTALLDDKNWGWGSIFQAVTNKVISPEAGCGVWVGLTSTLLLPSGPHQAGEFGRADEPSRKRATPTSRGTCKRDRENNAYLPRKLGQTYRIEVLSSQGESLGDRKQASGDSDLSSQRKDRAEVSVPVTSWVSAP